MEKDSGSFDISSLMKIANSHAGQQLLSMISQNRDPRFEEAMHQAESGDYTQAKEMLQQMLSTKEAQDLMKEIRGAK